MDTSPHDMNGLYKNMGEIQGTLQSLVTTVNSGFLRFGSDLDSFKKEFRDEIAKQNQSREEMRKELSVKIETLENFKSNYEGQKSEANRRSLMMGAISGAFITGAIEVVLHLFK